MKLLPLTNTGSTQVDDNVYADIARHKWRRNQQGYAVRSKTVGGKKSIILLHRELMKPHKGMDVDHIDGDRLNNLRSNLRICTRSQNAMNKGSFYGKSQYKGVSWIAEKQKWMATVAFKGKNRFLAYTDSETEAATYYNVAAQLFHGDFAFLNTV